MENTRPDLSQVDPEVREYILLLEQEIEHLKQDRPPKRKEIPAELDEGTLPLLDFIEPPTTINILSATANWVVKRTPRHLYSRQRRGGMGIFDLDTPSDEPAALLATADESQVLLFLTNKGRVFRLTAAALGESGVRAKGVNLGGKFNLEEDEKLCAILPEQAEGYLATVSQKGYVRMLRHHVFGDYMKAGMALYDARLHGELAGACWSPGDGDLFLATQQGKAIRFSEKLIPPGGIQGIRLDATDRCVSICAVDDDSKVFLLGDDGKGTIRSMENFNANKAPGAGGKQAMHANRVVAARIAQKGDDLFIITHLSKIIRFSVDEVPEKDGVVQGVVCIALRADQPVGLTTSA